MSHPPKHHANKQEIAKEQGIKAMPTFKAYKDGQVIEEFTGAVPAKLSVSCRQMPAVVARTGPRSTG